MKLLTVNQITSNGQVNVPITQESSSANFMQANTQQVDLFNLRKDCIIPSFAKDNESTISHAEFVEACALCALRAFSKETILEPAIRVSHPIKGRIPSAMGKPTKQLLEHEKTLYYERMAFIIEIPSICFDVNGNSLSLTIAGVRAYNLENLYGKKNTEKFKIAIGFKNRVCTNMCISTDGYLAELKVSSIKELTEKVMLLFKEFQFESMLATFTDMANHSLSEHQFAQLIGKMRLYNFLPSEDRKALDVVPITDSQIATVAKDYYGDKSFCRNDEGEINLWRVYNLFTGANKSSYIDTFLDRNAACLNFALMLQIALKSPQDNWFLS